MEQKGKIMSENISEKMITIPLSEYEQYRKLDSKLPFVKVTYNGSCYFDYKPVDEVVDKIQDNIKLYENVRKDTEEAQDTFWPRIVTGKQNNNYHCK